MFKTTKKCPLCGSNKKSKIINNNKNIYSFFLSKILNLNEDYIIKKMQNFKCSNCNLIYKKKWLEKRFIKKVYIDFQPTHPGGLNTLKKNFGKKKFISLFNKFKIHFLNKDDELYEKSKREITKILNNTENNSYQFNKLKNRFLKKLNSNDINYLNKNYLELSQKIRKPRIYSQFSGFRSEEISRYFNKKIDLKKINTYAEIGCPLWGNYNYFKKPWIKQYFVKLKENNFWRINKKMNDNCINYLSKKIKIKSKKKLNKIDFIGVYNFLDHLEYPLKIFNNIFKYTSYFAIICEDYNLSKKIDCQHFSSWDNKSLTFLSKKIGFKIINEPFRLGNSFYKLYILKKSDK